MGGLARVRWAIAIIVGLAMTVMPSAKEPPNQ